MVINTRILNKSINYIETDRLAKDDENYPTIGYEIVIDGINRTLNKLISK